MRSFPVDRPRAMSHAGLAALATRLLLGGVFVYAGVIKLPDPAASVRAIRAYRALPEVVVPAVGYGLPVLEVALGVLLLLGFAVRLAAVLTVLLLVVFIVGMASAWARGLSIDCGCFGGGGEVAAGETQYGRELARDLGLLAGAIVLARWPGSRLSLDARVAGGHSTEAS